ncbi:MAG TPA: tRNA (adenosine(37)-N6)-threonylcarbamoyltransferase complex dimerization subunit type 1 TsaB [Acidimicrobiales bacterium]
MNALAIETATETVGVAVRTDGGVQAELTLEGRRHHVEALTPALEHLLVQVGLEVGNLSVIAVDLGPGLFTGLRVGVAAAKGLAQALGLGVIGLSSLDILTHAAAEAGHRGLVVSVVDARRGEVFATVSEVGGTKGTNGTNRTNRTIVPPGLFSPEALAAVLAGLRGEPMIALGDGARRYAEVITPIPGVTAVMDTPAAPPPGTMLTMAAALLAQGVAPVEPQLVVPLYMREADAKSNFARVTRS